MRYGVTIQGVIPPQELAELAAWIEDLGFDDIWLTDSSLHAGEVYIHLACALQATSRVTIGTAVTNPITRHPALTANAFRTLEELAPGRVSCGIGVGDSPLRELGTGMAKLQTLEDAIAALRALWAGEEVTGDVGRFRFEGAKLMSSTRDVPVHISASGPRALETTGRIADGAILLAGLFPEGLAFAREHLARGAERREREQPLRTTCFLYGAISDDRATALDVARPIAAWFPQTAPVYAQLAGMSEELIREVVSLYGGGEFQKAAAAARLVPDDFVQKMAFAGTPADAEEKLDWLRGAGVDAMSVFPLGDTATRRATIAAFAEIALPR